MSERQQVAAVLPKMSIVTPSYNQGHFLEETILSVLNQGYPELEYILVDGGSSDGSVDIIEKYAQQLAYWVSEPDNGQSHAINKGFRRATGDILAWLNSDDLYLPGALQTVGRFLAEHPEVDMIYGDQVDIDEMGRVFRATRSLNFSKLGLLSRAASIPQPTFFMRRHVYEQVGGLDETLDWCMDYEYVLRIAFAGHRIVRIPQNLAKFRYHGTSKTVVGKTETRQHDDAMEHIQDRYRGRLPRGVIRLVGHLFRVKRYVLNIDRYFAYRGYYSRRLAGRFLLHGRSERF